jgi:environmental stress-induced protein Ves
VPAGAPPLQVLRAAQRQAVPWKNGGGLTREVAISPTGATPREFDWRVSIAEIAAAGPFSVFAGIDRRMAVLKGRLSLKIDAQPAVTVSPDSAPVAFPGEAPVFATPLGATVTDLNVMTRRGWCTADLTRHAAGVVLEPRNGTTLLIARSVLKISAAGRGAELAFLDALVLGSEPVSVLAGGASPVSFDLVAIRGPGGE